jgi:hypothetical protein
MQKSKETEDFISKTGEFKRIQNWKKAANEVGGDISNKTGEAVKKVGIGAADVLSNISGEIKQGLSGNSSK